MVKAESCNAVASWKSSEEKEKQAPEGITQLKLTIPLYLVNSHNLGPTKLLLQPCLRSALKSSEEQEGPSSLPGVLSATTHNTHFRTLPLLWVLRSHPNVVWGALQCSTATCRASALPQVQKPLLLRCHPRARGLSPPVELLHPDPGPATCPCWARSKMYENTFNHFFETVKK